MQGIRSDHHFFRERMSVTMYLIVLLVLAIAVAIYLIMLNNKKKKITENAEENGIVIKSFHKKAAWIIAGVVALVIVICVLLNTNKPVDFQKDFSEYQYEYWCDIADDNSYLKIDTNPSDRNDFYYEEAADAIQDVNRELGFSSALYQKMLETRALDGRQYDENDRVKVSWTYHPDRGLVVTYEKKD